MRIKYSLENDAIKLDSMKFVDLGSSVKYFGEPTSPCMVQQLQICLANDPQLYNIDLAVHHQTALFCLIVPFVTHRSL